MRTLTLILISFACACGATPENLGQNEAAITASGLSTPVLQQPKVTKWAVIACKFSDKPAEPKTTDWFRDLFTARGAGQGGLYDYWHDQSYGAISLDGSTVTGWLTIPYSRA